MSDCARSAAATYLPARTSSICFARPTARHSAISRALRVATIVAISLSAPACRAYRPLEPPSLNVEPVRVRFTSPREVVLRRQSPDSVLHSVTRLEGTLLWFDRDSLRLDVSRAEISGGWTDVAAPSTTAIANNQGAIVEHRRLSRTRTIAIIAVLWIGATIAVVASLK